MEQNNSTQENRLKNITNEDIAGLIVIGLIAAGLLLLCFKSVTKPAPSIAEGAAPEVLKTALSVVDIAARLKV
ncbi:MAG: hypothetical protein ACPGU4_13365 [Flavobacteriales bacterium]